MRKIIYTTIAVVCLILIGNGISDHLLIDNEIKVEEHTKKDSEQEQLAKESFKTMTVKATAYTANCKGCSGITATGKNLIEDPDAKVIAVDPKVIPLGTKVWVEGYGEAIASDTGGAIKGNRIDLFMNSHKDAIKYGVQSVDIKVYF